MSDDTPTHHATSTASSVIVSRVAIGGFHLCVCRFNEWYGPSAVRVSECLCVEM